MLYAPRHSRQLEPAVRPTYQHAWRSGLLLLGLMLLGAVPLAAQQDDADEAWRQGRYEVARRTYERMLRHNPSSTRANLRLGTLLAWDGKLDSALVLISRARAADPSDPDMALTHARVRSWKKEYDAALALYDSVLARHPALREAELGRAQTLAWAGRLEVADSIYRSLLGRDPSDREASLGQAQVTAWRGDFRSAEAAYRAILAQNPRDAGAMAGLAQVHYWQGELPEAGRQATAALAVDSTQQMARELRRTIAEATRTRLEATAGWSNDSDRNTSFWQSLGSSAAIRGGLSAYGSINALETRDRFRGGTRAGGEAGLSFGFRRINLSAAAGARRIYPELTAARTSATYRGRVGYHPLPALKLSLGYSRSPFDEIATLMERALDMELLEGGFDARPFGGFTIYAAGSELWLSDGNSRTGVLAGLSQKLHPRITVGLFGRTLSFDRSGEGYFSPNRFSVLEGTAGYSIDTRSWVGSIGGGLGAQQVGEGGAAQTEWHLEGRLGHRWGVGNRVELFGLVTNSAVSSTSGAFRYRSAGVVAWLGL